MWYSIGNGWQNRALSAIQVATVTCSQAHLTWHPGLENFSDNKDPDCIHHHHYFPQEMCFCDLIMLFLVLEDQEQFVCFNVLKCHTSRKAEEERGHVTKELGLGDFSVTVTVWLNVKETRCDEKWRSHCIRLLMWISDIKILESAFHGSLVWKPHFFMSAC